MTTPREYDVHETAEILGHSVSWLYHNAGKSIPVIRRARRLRWTDELIEQIIRDHVQQPRQQKAKQERKSSATRSGPKSAKPCTTSNVPQARPERARRLRELEGR